MAASNPTVVEVVRFEDLPPGSLASRRAVVRWSDGTIGECLRWYADEVLVSEGDLIGKTQEQLRSLHFHRDRDWLQS
ncbi:MAG TPA: hypothetical protein VME22_02660 [Solirubrobacteraceae bacterium]|nr:hypothetical protein [Solirubrobacteraceae bacterium]